MDTSQVRSSQFVRRLAWTYWRDLEAVVGEAYRREGYSVLPRGGPQPDGGVDLELRRGDERLIVQCKHWLNRQVPVQKVREMLGVVVAEGATGGVFVATSGFTAEARRFAVGQPLTLIDGSALSKLAQTVHQPAAGRQQTQRPAIEAAPVCPSCGKSMVRRTARRGQNAGSEFWGCAGYPACKGIRAA